jgi:glutathione S-transferase
MPSYKLTYFPIRGLGEFIRLIFHYAKVPFEDNRISFEDWPNLKSSKLSASMYLTKIITDMPHGKIPVLEFDGKILPESFAIARYISRQHGNLLVVCGSCILNSIYRPCWAR